MVTLPYPEGTNADEYDFVVTHMFDEDVNGHHAGEVETPEVTESENGISFRLMGTSPVMIGYKKVAATHIMENGRIVKMEAITSAPAPAEMFRKRLTFGMTERSQKRLQRMQKVSKHILARPVVQQKR